MTTKILTDLIVDGEITDGDGNVLSNKQKVITYTTVTLPFASWSSSTQTVTVSGMTSAKTKWKFGLQSGQGSSVITAVISAKIDVTAQGTDSLTFTCYGIVPTMDINIIIEQDE
ncbi:MAG: hypothetical protein WCS15_11700 [Prevotella sp.]